MERMQRCLRTKTVHEQGDRLSEHVSPYFMQHQTNVLKDHDESQSSQTKSVEKMEERQFTPLTELTNLTETSCESQSSQIQLQQSVSKLYEWQSTALTELTDLTHKLRESEAACECQHQNLLEVHMTLEQVNVHYDTELKNQEALRSRVEHSHTACNNLQKHCEVLEVTLQKCIFEKDKLTEQYNKQSAQIHNLESYYTSLKEVYKHKIKSLEIHLSKEQAQSRREQQKHMENHARLEKCYELLKEGLQEQLSQEQGRFAELDKKLAAAESIIEQMKMTKILIRQEFSMKMGIAKEEIHQLSHRKEEQEILLRDAQQENAQLKIVAEKNKCLENELLEKSNRIVQLDEAVKKHAKTVEELNLRMEATRQEMEQLKIETDNTVTQLISKESDLQQKVCIMEIKSEKEVSELMRALDEGRNQAATIEASLRLQLERCQLECETLKVKGLETECSLRDELQVALDFITQLKLKISDDTENYQNTKYHFDEQRKCLEDQIKIHEEAEQQMTKEVMHIRDELKKSYEHQHAAEEAAAQREQILKAAILEKKCSVETLQSDINTLVKEQALANSTIKEKEMETLHVVQQLEKLKEIFETVSQKAGKLDEECNSLKEKLETINKCIKTSEDETNALKQSCQLLECTLQSENSELLDLKNSINSKDSTIISLEKLLNESKETCQEFENEKIELSLHIETSRKKSEQDIQVLEEKFKTEISAQEENRSVLETRNKELEHQCLEIQKNLEKVQWEFQNNLQIEKNKTQEQLQIAGKKYTEKLFKKDKMLEEVCSQLKCSDLQANKCKEQLANLEKQFTETIRRKETALMEKERELKLVMSKVDIFKKTSDEYITQLGDAQNNFHQAKADLNKLQKHYEYNLVELQKVKSKLSKAQIQRKHAEREAMTSKSITKRIESEFSTYKMERKRMRMQAAHKRSKSLPARGTPYPSLASSSSSTSECPRTPTNTTAPTTPQSILKSSKAISPEYSGSAKKVKFTVDYTEAGSSSSSITQELEDTGAMCKEQISTLVMTPKKKNKENIKYNSKVEKVEPHQDYKYSTKASSSHTEVDGLFKKPFPVEWSNTSDTDFIKMMLD